MSPKTAVLESLQLALALCTRWLEPLKKLGASLRTHAAAVRGTTDSRSNAFVDATNGLLQPVTRAVRCSRASRNLLAHRDATA